MKSDTTGKKQAINRMNLGLWSFLEELIPTDGHRPEILHNHVY